MSVLHAEARISVRTDVHAKETLLVLFHPQTLTPWVHGLSSTSTTYIHHHHAARPKQHELSNKSSPEALVSQVILFFYCFTKCILYKAVQGIYVRTFEGNLSNSFTFCTSIYIMGTAPPPPLSACD